MLCETTQRSTEQVTAKISDRDCTAQDFKKKTANKASEDFIKNPNINDNIAISYKYILENKSENN